MFTDPVAKGRYKRKTLKGRHKGKYRYKRIEFFLLGKKIKIKIGPKPEVLLLVTGWLHVSLHKMPWGPTSTGLC